MRTREGDRAGDWPTTRALKVTFLVLLAVVLADILDPGLPEPFGFVVGFATPLLVIASVMLAARMTPLIERLRSRFGRNGS